MGETLTVKSFESPDEEETFENGRVEATQIGAVTFWLGTVEPDWLWSRDNGPDIGTERCPVPHQLYMVAGRMTIEMDDGTQQTLEKGDTASIPPGHDAWVEGDEQAVFLDVQL